MTFGVVGTSTEWRVFHRRISPDPVSSNLARIQMKAEIGFAEIEKRGHSHETSMQLTKLDRASRAGLPASYPRARPRGELLLEHHTIFLLHASRRRRRSGHAGNFRASRLSVGSGHPLRLDQNRDRQSRVRTWRGGFSSSAESHRTASPGKFRVPGSSAKSSSRPLESWLLLEIHGDCRPTRTLDANAMRGVKLPSHPSKKGDPS